LGFNYENSNNILSSDLEYRNNGYRTLFDYNSYEEKLSISFMRKVRESVELGAEFKYNNKGCDSEKSYLARYYSKDDKFLLFSKIVNEENDSNIRFGVAEQLNNNFGYGTEFKFSLEEDKISEATFCLKHDFIHGNVKASINNSFKLRVQSTIQLTKSSHLDASLEADIITGEKKYSLNFQTQ